MDVELAAVITNEANQATDAENTTVTTEAVSKPITTIVILDNDTSQEMEAETSSQTNIEKNPTAPVAVATETLDEQELETSIQKIEEDVCETINLSKLAEKTKAKKKTTKPTKCM
jgi:porphobilinogen deaminase